MDYKGVAQYHIDELIPLIEANMPFIRGITVSGGEATLYHKYLTDLFKAVHDLGLTCYIDTNGFFDLKQIKACVDETDKFLFDVKGIGQDLTRLCFTDVDNETEVNAVYKKRFSESSEHLDNLKALLALDKIEEVRLVYIKGFYDVNEVIHTLADIMKSYPHVPIKIIRVHGRGLPKNRAVHLKGAVPSKQDMSDIEAYAQSLGIANVITIL
jgi:pyruvate-formate lyase-activating enzyme